MSKPAGSAAAFNRICALAGAGAWTLSLGLNAFGMSGATGVRWYLGLVMALGGLAWQVLVVTVLAAGPPPDWRSFCELVIPEMAWGANLVLGFVLIRLALGRPPSPVAAGLPIVMAMFAFGIRRFAIPDDDSMPVVAYGAGFWLWLASMFTPAIAGFAAWRRRRSSL